MSNAMTYTSDHGEGLLRSNPSLFEHIHAVIFGGDNFADVSLFAVVKAAPHLAPIAAC